MSDAAATSDIGRLLLRLVVGAWLLPHGFGKLFGWFGGPGLAGFAAELEGFGLPAAAPLPWLLAAAQTLAGLLIVIGLWTRTSAAVAAAFLAVTVVLNVPHGWFWMHGGIEYPLLWTLAAIAVMLMGAGRHSVDAARISKRSLWR